MNATRKSLFVIPAFALAAVAVTLVGGAIFGSSNVPDQARSVTNPKRADNVAPAPDALSSVTVTRDWQEVVPSRTKR